MAVVKLAAQTAHAPRVKGCMNCAYLVRESWTHNNPTYWQCGHSGSYCEFESAPGGRCGLAKVNWMPIPPSRWAVFCATLGQSLARCADALRALIHRITTPKPNTEDVNAQPSLSPPPDHAAHEPPTEGR